MFKTGTFLLKHGIEVVRRDDHIIIYNRAPFNVRLKIYDDQMVNNQIDIVYLRTTKQLSIDTNIFIELESPIGNETLYPLNEHQTQPGWARIKNDPILPEHLPGYFGSTPSWVPLEGCAHSWKLYQGFTETYEYCEHCDEKRDKS